MRTRKKQERKASRMSKPGRILLILCLFALPLAAQSAAVHGRVTLSDGTALPGVTVSIDDLGLTAVTDADGRYTLTIPADRARGAVRVTATLSGFQTQTETVTVGG